MAGPYGPATGAGDDTAPCPPAPPIHAHVRLDTHPTHPSAVIAVLTGSQAHITHTGLEAVGWTVVAENVLVLVRIDHAEPYWAKDAAAHLAAEGTTVDITPRLQEAMDEEWTWASYPMRWCTRSEIRQISNEAQKIHDDIRHGRLLIHAHHGHTTVAVGTYLGRTGKSVYLHGEDHLRQIADTFDSPAQALVAFEKVHAADMRPGPAPLTDAESDNARALVSLQEPGTPPSTLEEGPVYAVGPHDQDGLLNKFLTENKGWKRHRTWDDNTTVAAHESLTLRILFDRNAESRAARWTIAGYGRPSPTTRGTSPRPAPSPSPWSKPCSTTSPSAAPETPPLAAPSFSKPSPPRPDPSRTRAGRRPKRHDGPAGRAHPGTQGSGWKASAPAPRAAPPRPGGSGTRPPPR